MKIFKKAISLVLVFAMLASFAGMTGYKYSPMSIEAQAAPSTWIGNGGVQITMERTQLYKQQYASTRLLFTDESTSSGDYLITNTENDLTQEYVFPSGTSDFALYMSVYPNDSSKWIDIWGTLPTSSYGLTFERGDYLGEKMDYGKLTMRGEGNGNKLVGGFKNFDRIYYKLVYTVNGTPYTETWDTAVVDTASGINIKWDSQAKDSKPIDSFSAKNELKNVHVPSTLYLSGGSIVSSLSSYSNETRTFDTYVMFTVPANAFDVRVYQVDANDAVITEKITWADPTNTSRSSKTYGTKDSAYVLDNTYKWTISGSPDAGNVYYRIEYKMEVAMTTIYGDSENLSTSEKPWNHTVTYRHYAASVVKELPNYNVVWCYSAYKGNTWDGSKKFVFTFAHHMSLLPALVRNGVEFNTSTIDVTSDFNGDWDCWSHFSGNKAIGVKYSTGTQTYNDDDLYVTAKNNKSQTATSASLGGTIYYDPRSTTVNTATSTSRTTTSEASIGMDMSFWLAHDGEKSGASNWKWSKFDAYGECWYNTTITYNNKENVGTYKTLESLYSGASHKVGSNSYNGKDLTIGTSDDLGEADSARVYTYSYTLNNLAGIPKTLRATCRPVGKSKNSNSSRINVQYGFHIDIVEKNRDNAHDYIDAAIKNNYVKEEMSVAWWNTYRQKCFDAYLSLANLDTGSDITASVNSILGAPEYKFADYTKLINELHIVAPYDRGGKTGTTGAETGNLDAGSEYKKWNTAYNGSEVSGELAVYNKVWDDATKTLVNEKENGIDKVRTGEYYYKQGDANTIGTWEHYEVARNMAARVYNYPESWNDFKYTGTYATKSSAKNTKSSGLWVYAEQFIEAYADNLKASREALISNGVKQTIDYNNLIKAINYGVYDSESMLDLTSKHGLENVPAGSDYNVALLKFRTNHDGDCFKAENLKENSIELKDGYDPVTGEDKGVYDYYYVNSEDNKSFGIDFRGAVGYGHPYHQANFYNGDNNNGAVTSLRKALGNRLVWKSGTGTYKMVEGPYNKDDLTEAELLADYTQYLHTSIEHQDDIYRAAGAIYSAASELRLLANYYPVVNALNNERPTYDLGGTEYNSKGLNTVTMFHGYGVGATPDTSHWWDQPLTDASGNVLVDGNNMAYAVADGTGNHYATTGLTWYTYATWSQFVAKRNVLTNMVYNSDNQAANHDYATHANKKYHTSDSYGDNKTYTHTAQNLAADYQQTINNAVAEYKAWFDGEKDDEGNYVYPELELKNLDEYQWAAYDKISGVSEIEKKVGGLYQSLLTGELEVVKFIPIVDETTGKITGEGATLGTDKVPEYDPEDLAELAALADVVTALDKTTGDITTGLKFNNGMSLADKAKAFDTALAEFDAKYKEISSVVGYVDKSGWQGIFDHLTALNGGETVNTTNIGDFFGTVYTDDGTTKTQVQAVAGRTLTTQDDYNTAVTDLYNLLKGGRTAVKVQEAADLAVNEANQNFIKYNPYDVADSTNESLVDEVTAEDLKLEKEIRDGITVVYKYADIGRNDVISYAEDNRDTQYPLLSTYIADINAKANIIKAKAGLVTLDGVTCELVDRGVQTDVLDAAIAEATDKLGDGGSATVLFPSKPEQNYTYNMSSAEAVAELQEVIRLANEASKDGSTADQLAIDKLVFAIIEEMDNSRLVISQPVQAAYRVWTHTYNTDGTIASTTFTDQIYVFTDAMWETLLHSKLSHKCMDMGLEYALARHDLLALEIKVPREIDKDMGVWDADGNIIDKDGNIVTSDYYNNGYGKVLYTAETWKEYTDAILAAQSLIAAQTGNVGSVKLKADKQGDINAAAQLIYDKREALQYNSFATHTPGHSQASKFYRDVKSTLTAVVNVYDYDVVTGKSAAIPVELYDKEKYIDLEAALDEFYAMYVGDAQTPPEAQNTEQAYADMKSFANSIYEAVSYDQPYPDFWTSEEPYEPTWTYSKVYPRTMDDKAFQVGWQSILEDFIAGNYTDGQYTSALLNADQVAKLDELLDAASAFINYDSATVELVNSFVSAVETIFTYTTTTNAKDMKFAVAMKNQIFGFMEMKFNYGGVSFYNDGAKAEDYVFNQDELASTKESINNFFAADNSWPYIYQVNDLVVTQEAGTEIYSVTTPADAESFNSANPEKTTAEMIQDIFLQVGNQSQNYTAILDVTGFVMNAYHTEAFNWIMANAVINGGDGKTYVLADLEPDVSGSSSITLDNAAINYDVAKGRYWYTEGKGTKINDRRYYLFANGSDADRIIGSSVNGWFEDDTYNSVVNHKNSIPHTFEQFFYFDEYNPVTNGEFNATIAGYDNGTSLDEAGRTGNSYTFAQIILSETDGGWTKQRENDLRDFIQAEQDVIDTAAQRYYEYIQALELLPATAAYRDIEILYQAAVGNGANAYAVTFSDSDYTRIVSNESERTLLTEAVFYNNNNDFLTQLGVYNWPKDAEYGTSASLPAQYDKGPEWSALQAEYEEFTKTTAKTMITIDRVSEVEAIKEEMIGYIRALPLVRFDFTQLEKLVKAFFNNGSTEALNALVNDDVLVNQYKYDTPYDGAPQYYKAEFYTHDSLLEVLEFLYLNNVIKSDLYNAAIDKNYSYMFNFTKELSGGEFFSNPTYDGSYGDDAIGAIVKALVNKIMELKLKPADTTELDKTIEQARKIIEEESNLYVQDEKWTNLLQAYGDENTESSAIFTKMMCEIPPEEWLDAYSYYSEALNSGDVSKANQALAKALEGLTKRSDSTAPHMSILTTNREVASFYDANKEQLATLDPAGAENPITGSYIVPNSSGYSLMVYTNELNPRIVMTIQDLADIVDASKKEKISVSAARTSGVVANLIYGTQNATGEIEKINLNTVTNGGSPVKDYINELPNADDSKIFAILAPTFVASTANKKAPNAQAAMYTIEVSDGASKIEGVAEGTQDNFVREVDLGIDGLPSKKVVDDNKTAITIYVYYHNIMSETNDEGIDANGSATQAITDSTQVASVNLSGEPDYDGTTWRNGLVLKRSFSDRHSVWEYVSPVLDSKDSGVPGYYDYTFKYLNTGSFYYVINRTAETMILEDISDEQLKKETAINKAILAEYGKATLAGKMNYAKATDAKQLMIDYINGEIENGIVVGEKAVDVFATLKASDNFYSYGDYERDDVTGKIEYYDNGEPKWINWAQAIGGKVENGDLVFIHVVDRWGNVVNRIVEITNLDKNVPGVETSVGVVTIAESGGSGVGNIQIGNGITSEGSIDDVADYLIDSTSSQNVKIAEGSKMLVECSTDSVILSGLISGRTYYINVHDNAGNIKSVAVRADENGNIVIKVVSNKIETGEEGSIVNNSSTFTLNGTDVVILNAGEASSVLDANIEGNVFANRTIRHYIITKDNVTALKTVYQDGTVEEFTPDTVTVTDMGDGTLKWLIPRKLAEGTHTYKVYAKVDGEYERFYAPATISATSRTIRFTYKIAGMGRTVLKFGGSNEIKNSTMDSREIPYGAKVTITAEQTSSSSNFYYWMNGQNDRIISAANTYEFTAVTNTNLVAQFTSYESIHEGKKLVVYVNNAKNVVKAFELADGDDYTVPTGPVLSDYTFMGWSMTKDEVLASEKDTIIVEPIYELNATNTVTITEGNYTATGAGTYTAEDNQRAVVTISADAKDGDGKDFLYWIDADTEEVVSYYRTYSFFCVKDTVLTPVYGDGSTVQAEPIVRITEVKFNALSGKVSFFAERSVPEEFAILQTGIVVTKTESIGTNEEVFVVGGTSTAAGTSTSTANNGFYSANATVATGQTVWARAYVIYETADGEIFETYGPVVSYTVD